MRTPRPLPSAARLAITARALAQGSQSRHFLWHAVPMLKFSWLSSFAQNDLGPRGAEKGAPPNGVVYPANFSGPKEVINHFRPLASTQGRRAIAHRLTALVRGGQRRPAGEPGRDYLAMREEISEAARRGRGRRRRSRAEEQEEISSSSSSPRRGRRALGGGGGRAIFFFMKKPHEEKARGWGVKSADLPRIWSSTCLATFPARHTRALPQGQRSCSKSLDQRSRRDQPVMAAVMDSFQTYLRELRTGEPRGSAGSIVLRDELTRRKSTSRSRGQGQTRLLVSKKSTFNNRTYQGRDITRHLGPPNGAMPRSRRAGALEPPRAA